MNAAPEDSLTPHPPGEREVFLAALEFALDERAAFLDRACAGNPGMRASVENLLRLSCDDTFLANPALGASRPNSGNGDPTPPTPPTPPSPDGPPSPTVGDTIGRYKLLQQIGEGGAGTVYMAEQSEPVRRRVALKVVKAGMDSKSVIARFESERQALAMMEHPNIAKVFDAGTTSTGRPYFVMELVRGTRITSYCDENQLPTRERLELFIRVGQAIQHAHQKGIIHRDIKPSNILVTLHDGVPVPKVIDFGIAKAIDQRLTDRTFFTEFQAFIGTPAYMSPEQAEMSGLDVDTRSDVYSLGVLLYEMLTGRTPFDAQELISAGLDGMRRTIRERDPVAPSTRLRSLVDAERTTTAQRQRTESARLVGILHGDLDWIVLKALEKDRTRRYETAFGLARDVQRYLEDEPVTARPPSTLYRLEKLARRNRLAVVGMGAFAAAMVFGLALTTWQYLLKSEALRRAQTAEQLERGLREAAQHAQAQELQLRRRAEAQELQARRRAYAADINLAQEALGANNLGRAKELLNHHRPTTEAPDLRGWEWRYLWSQCRSDALFALAPQSNEVASVAISGDRNWVAAGDSMGGLSVSDLRSHHEVLRVEAGGGRVRTAFSPVAPLLAFSASDDRAGPPPPGPGRGPGGRSRQKIRLWDASDRRYAGEFPIGGGCLALSFTSDGALLIVASSDGRLTAWGVADGTLIGTHELPELSRFGGTVQVSSDLTLVAYTLEGGRIRLLELPSGRERWTRQAAEERVMSMAFSPDGSRLATGAGFVESSIRLWDTATGTEAERLEGHRTWVSALVFWPDGSKLASASADQTIRLWDLGSRPGSTGESRNASSGRSERERATLRGHALEIWSLALASDNRTLVSGCKDGTIFVWDAGTLRRERTHLVAPVAGVGTWCFAADSRSILAIDARGALVRCQGEDFQEKVEEREPGGVGNGGAGPGFLNEFSPDARYLATMRPGNGLQVWDIERHQALDSLRDSHAVGFPVGFLAASNHLVTRRGPNNTLVEWDLGTGTEVRSWQLGGTSGSPGPGPGPGLLAFTPDGRWWLAVDRSGRGSLVDREGGSEVAFEFGHGQVGTIRFSPDGRRFGSVSGLGIGDLWETSPLRKISDIRGFLQGQRSIAFSPDSLRIAIGSDGREALKILESENGHELVTLGAEGSGFRSTAFSPDGNILGSANSRGQLHLWRADFVEEMPEPSP